MSKNFPCSGIRIPFHWGIRNLFGSRLSQSGRSVSRVFEKPEEITNGPRGNWTKASSPYFPLVHDLLCLTDFLSFSVFSI